VKRRACIGAIALAATLAVAGSAAARLPLTASTSVTPQPSFFGERITARVEVVVDAAVVDPRTVQVTMDWSPYALVGQPRRSSVHGDGVTTVGFVYTLSCLDDGCLPGTRTRAVSFSGGKVESARRAGGDETLALHWPPVLVVPRVSAVAAAASPPPWRVQLALPPVDYRVTPATAIPAVWAAAVALAAVGLALVGWELVRHRRIRRERERALSELAQALQLVRESERRSVDDRRRALALLSRVLASDGADDARLADDATRLAWARPEPSPARIEELVREIEREVVQR
jgi:hypothetical protein